MRAASPAVVALGLLLCPPLPATGEDDVDRHVRATLEALRIPGASVAVVRDGRVVKAAGYGLANLETATPASPGTVYEIGSMTKQFTAVALVLLAEEGKVDLDGPLAAYFPGAPAWWKGVTLRHVLTHTSGIRNHVAVQGYLSRFKTTLFFEDSPSREEVLQGFYELPMEFEPGETWAYDNTGYWLLGVVVERASGLGFFEFLEERLFRPLGMRSTRSTDPRPLVPGRASGYEWVGDRWENRRVLLPSVGFSAGALLSTVEDLARWDAALRSGRLLGRGSLEAMWTPAPAPGGELNAVDYGSGWFLESYGGRRDVHHGGGTPGFSSTMHRFVDEGLAVVVLTNHADTILDQVALDIAGMFEPALRARPGPDGDPRATARHRRIFADLLEGRADPADLTRPLLVHLGTATGRGLFRWYASRGALGAFASTGREDGGDTRVHRYRVSLGPGSYRFSFKVRADGRVAQIYCW